MDKFNYVTVILVALTFLFLIQSVFAVPLPSPGYPETETLPSSPGLPGSPFIDNSVNNIPTSGSPGGGGGSSGGAGAAGGSGDGLISANSGANSGGNNLNSNNSKTGIFSDITSIISNAGVVGWFLIGAIIIIIGLIIILLYFVFRKKYLARRYLADRDKFASEYSKKDNKSNIKKKSKK